MIKAHANTVIATPIERSFDFIGTRFFDNYQRWSPQVTRLEQLTQGPVRVGTRARQERVDEGHLTKAVFKVVKFEENRVIEFAGLTRPFRIRYQLTPAEQAGETRLDFHFQLKSLEFFLIPFEQRIRRVIEHTTAQTVVNIKALLEEQD